MGSTTTFSQSRLSHLDASISADLPPPPPSTGGIVDGTSMTTADSNDDQGGTIANAKGDGNAHNQSLSLDQQPQQPQHQEEEELPIEYQLHEADLTNPEMDPLEYTFRRYIPIPKVYFWETSNESNQHHKDLPRRIKLWHNAIYYMGICLRKAEAGGEIVANILGLNSSQFDYVVDSMTPEEWEQSRENVGGRQEERRVYEEEKKAKEDIARGEEEVVRDVGLSSREVL